MNHRGQESTGPGGDQKSRLGLTREAQRKTAGPEAVAWYAKQNPAINVANTHLNVDMVNDGAGGFRPTSSIDEVVTYGDERVARLNTELKTGHRFAVTAVGQLPWDYLEPDGTEYQPVDAQGQPKVFKTGPRAGQPIMEPRYRIKPGYEEKAEAYWADWIEFQIGLLPDGQAGVHGYSINRDESREHIQLLGDPFEPAPSKKNPDSLKNGFSRAFGSHPKDRLVPKPGPHGQPELDADGEPVLIREGASRKYERYQREFREFMVARGHSVELERDEARHDRHLGLQDYKDLQHSQREVADTAEHLDIELATVADEREHYDEASVFVIQEAVEAELGEVMAQSQAIEADLATEREALAAEREQWEQTEKPQLEKKVTAEAKKAAETDWEANDKPELEKSVHADATVALDEALLDTLVDLEAANRALRGSDASPDAIRARYADAPLQPGGVPRRIEVVAGLAKAAADARQAKVDAEWEAVQTYDRAAVDKATSAEFIRQSKNVKLEDGSTAYEAIHAKTKTAYNTMHPEHKKGLDLKTFATETIGERQARRTAGTKRTHAVSEERKQARAAEQAAHPDSQRPKPRGQ